MGNLERRLCDLERRADMNAEAMRGMLSIEYGQNPLEAMEGQPPGMYLIVDDYSRGPAFLGRVTRSGGRVIIYGGSKHVHD